MAIAPTALTENASSAESAPTKVAAVPIALAERLDPVLVHPQVTSHEPPAAVERQPTPAPALATAPASHGDDDPLGPSHGGRAAYSGSNPSHTRGLLLLLVFAAVGGTVLWMSLGPTSPPDRGTTAGGARTAAPVAASSAPGAPPRTADTSAQSPPGDRPPTTDPPSLSSGSSGSPTAGGESISPSAEVRPSTEASSEPPVTIRESKSPGANVAPPASGRAPDSVEAQAPSRAEAVESPDGGPAKTSDAGGAGDPRRVITKGRTKEQADRDAIATQRAIARELGNSLSTDSGDKAQPGL